MINFNNPPFMGAEIEYISQAVKNKKISGDGEFTARCSTWLENMTAAKKVLLTTSCTHALEMAAILCDIKEGDEVIMPSFTFVSTANAFVLRGAKIVFVDVRRDTLNIDEALIEPAITDKTKAIVPVHYAGVACEMDTIMQIAARYKLLVVEDAAQGVMSAYKGKPLGAIGDLGCYSFHETKNYSMGEGGALVINNERFIDNAVIIREKGTNRTRFLKGFVDKYSWVSLGSSYLPSELNAAYLFAQLEQADSINLRRIEIWNAYKRGLAKLEDDGYLKLPVVPTECVHNGHMFFIRTTDEAERTRLIDFLKDRGVMTVFHYVPLHSSEAGTRYGRFFGDDINTTRESSRLVRLPMYLGLEMDEVMHVIDSIYAFYNSRGCNVTPRPNLDVKE